MNLPPNLLATMDQYRAQTRDALAREVDNARSHIASHDGDTVCAYASIAIRHSTPFGGGSAAADRGTPRRSGHQARHHGAVVMRGRP